MSQVLQKQIQVQVPLVQSTYQPHAQQQEKYVQPSRKLKNYRLQFERYRNRSHYGLFLRKEEDVMLNPYTRILKLVSESYRGLSFQKIRRTSNMDKGVILSILGYLKKEDLIFRDSAGKGRYEATYEGIITIENFFETLRNPRRIEM